jgi:putative transcriptional regulator
MENKGYEGSLKGQFLMAMPGLVDPNFHQTVTCMCEHNSQGAMGLVVNRVQNALMAKDIFEELKIEYSPGAEKIPIHTGGPVHIAEIFVLHGPPFDWEASLRITQNLALSNTRDILECIGQRAEFIYYRTGMCGLGARTAGSRDQTKCLVDSSGVRREYF